MAGLAKSIFSRTPDESTVVEDVYKKTTSEVVNSFQDISKTGLELGKQFGFLSNVSSGNLLKLASDGMLSLNTESLTDKIAGAFSDEYSKAKSLVGDVLSGKTSVIDTIKGTTNSVTGLLRKASDVYYTVNGVVSTVKNGNVSDLRGIVNTINQVTNRTSIALSANGALGGIMTSLIGEAGALGIKDAFGIVAAGVKDSTDITNKGQLIYQMATGSLPGAIARGDLRSVASIVDHLGNGAASMLNPSAVKQLARTDKTQYTSSEIRGSNGQFYEYQGAYQRIDPNWNKSSWTPAGSSTQIRDLSNLMGASSQVKDIFTTGSLMSTNVSDKLYAALKVFNKPKSVDEEILRRYPLSTAATSSGMEVRDTDPRLLKNLDFLLD